MATLTVTASDFFQGTAMPDASVQVVLPDNTALTSRSNVDGLARFEGASFAGRIAANASAAGFSPQSTIVNNAAASSVLTTRVALQAVNARVELDASTGGDLMVDDLAVATLPPASVVDADDNAYTGTIVADITLIDPSSDPSLMPGDYQSLNSATQVVSSIQSHGAINIDLNDTNGSPLSVANGQTATIRIPVASAEANPPAAMPLFFYNEALGYWVEEGEAVLTTVGNSTVYVGQVDRMETWNADIPYETVLIEGCVQDEAGNRLANVNLQSRGQDYIGTSSTRSDTQGNFFLPACQSSAVLITAISGNQSRTLQESTTTSTLVSNECLVVTPAESTITLTWGENPPDLDTRFYGIDPVDNSNNFHIYFGNKQQTIGDTTFFLDVDDTSSFGPEVLSIPQFPFAGTYRYTVDLFAGTGDIQLSPARIELNLEGDVRVFSPPSGTPTACWAAFDLVVDDAQNVTVLPLNTWQSQGYCTAGNFVNTANARSALGNTQLPSKTLFEKALDEKYYAR